MVQTEQVENDRMNTDITGLQQFSMHLLGVLNYTLRFVNVQTEVFNYT